MEESEVKDYPIKKSSSVFERADKPPRPERSIPSWQWHFGVFIFVLFVGLTVRLIPWSNTFTAEGVRFHVDTDPYYHTLRAQRMVDNWPYVPWRDPALNFPYGADILWPPLLDILIAGVAKAFGAGPQTPELVAKVGAFIPVAFGLAVLPLVMMLGSALFRQRIWFDAALLVAVLPASVTFSALGCTDQHVAELFFFCLIFLAFIWSWRPNPYRNKQRQLAPGLLAVAVTLSFWNWQGSAFYLLLLVSFTGLWHIFSPSGNREARDMARALLIGCGLAAVLIGITIALFGPPNALGRMSLSGLTGLHIVFCLMVAFFSGILLFAERVWSQGKRLERLMTAVIAAAVPAVVTFAFDPFREGVGQGFVALFRSNPWYASIFEFRPLIFSGAVPIMAELSGIFSFLGLSLFVTPFALPPMLRLWREHVEDRPSVLFLFFLGIILLFLTFARSRFELYLLVPLSLWCSLAIEAATMALLRRWPGRGKLIRSVIPVIGIFLLSAPALPTVLKATYAPLPGGLESDLIPLLRWLRGVPSAVDERPAVMSDWRMGHLIQYLARKPVVTSPFGTDGGANAMEDWAAFLFTSDSDKVEKILSRRRIGFLVLTSPADQAIDSFGFSPEGTAKPIETQYSWWTGESFRIKDGFWRLVASRLFYFDGMPARPGDVPSLGGFRLLAESQGFIETVGFPYPIHAYKVFGVVKGAHVSIRGFKPSSFITISVRVTTNQKRMFHWVTQCVSDRDGRAVLRLPYATGPNGLVRAGPYLINDGHGQHFLEVEEAAVANGSEIEVDFRK